MNKSSALTILLLFVAIVCLSSAKGDENPYCVYHALDDRPFPYESLADARTALAQKKYAGGNTQDYFIWSYYEANDDLDVDVYEFTADSPFGPSMIWRRPDYSDESPVFRVSARCEGTSEQCAAFDRFFNEIELKKKFGSCKD